MRPKIIIPLTVAAALLLPAAAQASSSQESVFQDDAALVQSSPEKRDHTLDELKRLGVDTIRTNVIWSWVAPHANSRRRPHFDAEDPAAYALGHWDDLIRAAKARGFDVLVTATGPVPLWASHCGGAARIRRVCRPDAHEFGRFVVALGRRWSGTYAGLPRVARWSIWNEPNQSGWLYPQQSRYHHRNRPEAAMTYRGLAYAAIGALHASGHARDQILLGETAPLGRRYGSLGKRSLSPTAFLNGVFCMNSRGHSLRGTDARALGCHRHYRRLLVTGFAHHPYTRAAGGDPRTHVGSEDITIATLGRLSRELNRGAHLRRLNHGLPIYLTEYGIQTAPPDRTAGVSLSRQAEWLNETDYMAFRNRRVRSVSQYELFDDPRVDSFQTGLRFHNGKGKPSWAAYRLPIWAIERHGSSYVWGQARAGGRGAHVEVLYQPSRHRHFRLLKRLIVGNSHGFFSVRTHRRAYRWRIYWRDSTGHLLGASRGAVPRSR